MCERILAQNCQKFDNFNFEFSMSHHNAHYQSYKNAPLVTGKARATRHPTAIHQHNQVDNKLMSPHAWLALKENVNTMLSQVTSSQVHILRLEI